MRAINLSNEKARNAQVGFEVKKDKSDISFALADGSAYSNVRMLKSTLATDLEALAVKMGSAEALARSIISEDPEIDPEMVGMRISGVKKVYLSSDGKVAYNITRQDIVYTPQGEEKEVRKFSEAESNVNGELPVRWTGKLVPKDKAIRMFVFTRSYQVKHVNGLTYDFLYDMARQLSEKNSLMLVGGGTRGAGPLVLSNGGTPYRGFLEGRIDGEKYCLILHLTNLELKTI